ncbi:MAG: CoA-binding protein [Desulfotalea sp.]|nr:MAG: CoA-binding protein [Desulfotalea sp.]
MQIPDISKENESLFRLLSESQSIAIVGLSPKKDRASNMVARYLLAQGYRVYPVNPGQSEILGQVCYADLASLPHNIDIIDIFRKSADVLAVVEQVVKLPKLPRAIWMQQGIINAEAAALAEKNGILVIMDRCIKIDHQNLLQ